MGIVSVSLPTDGTTADVADYNTPITTVVDEINGNIDNANIKTGAAIVGSKLADTSIPTAKYEDSSVTAPKVADGIVVQVVSTNFNTASTGTTILPADNTIPQNTEGDEYMTQAITPKSATNKLVIEVTIMGAINLALGNSMVAALFQDSTANGLAGDVYTVAGSEHIGKLIIRHTMTAGTTSATTFKVRAGPAVAGTFTFNGTAGARVLGGVTVSNIKITEYKAS